MTTSKTFFIKSHPAPIMLCSIKNFVQISTQQEWPENANLGWCQIHANVTSRNMLQNVFICKLRTPRMSRYFICELA